MPGTNSDNPNVPSVGVAGETREYGLQPLATILTERNITNHQVVAASTEQLTHKMMAKACRGRYLSSKVRQKILRAVNKVTGEEFRLSDLFTYH
ncbi:MAG: hypothetical protein IKR13_02795 [Victivallales bacterium]|nr:hypothetical protein [Victivallales bacterium]